jgi:hypothetical protein
MSPKRPGKPHIEQPASADIDALYGLEPVYEPGDAGSGEQSGQGTLLQRIQCPFCAEHFETQLDLSAGSANYFEDCQVCCQPIEMSLAVDDSGALARLTAGRGD